MSEDFELGDPTQHPSDEGSSTVTQDYSKIHRYIRSVSGITEEFLNMSAFPGVTALNEQGYVLIPDSIVNGVNMRAMAANVLAIMNGEVVVIARPDVVDYTDFEDACANFREVCTMIREFSGNYEFRGGFEEAVTFLKSPIYQANMLYGVNLFSMWQGANDACTYEARKVGIGQPAWWYRCWGITKK